MKPRWMNKPTRLRRAAAALTIAATAVTTVGVTAAMAAPSSAAHNSHAAKPTIVFVHGAFADASGFDDEITALSRMGYPVIAPPDPLRGLLSDAAYIRSVLDTISGPIILVGHSYGGSVITNAATGDHNVKALVYLDAFAPKRYESTASVVGNPKKYPGSLLGPKTLLPRPVQNPVAPGGTDTDLYINPVDFRSVFAGDVSPARAELEAATQRPLSNFAFNQKSGVPAFNTIPSWYLVGLDDRAISPAGQIYMATRMHAHITKIHSAHDVMISHPAAVDKMILAAVHCTT